MPQINRIGFIGLGVMGEPVCCNLITKSQLPVSVCDRNAQALERARALGATVLPDAGAITRQSAVVFISLPSGEAVEALAQGADGLLANARPGQIFVDLGTSPVALTRKLAEQFSQRGAVFADAPMARTRAAAVAGTLSIMVGCAPDTFEQLRPLIAHFASEITHCGGVGNGQVVKLMNNMVLFQTVMALSEAAAIAEAAGMDPRLALETMMMGSADSFALRNHAAKAILPRDFPEKAFPVSYALKDLRCALELANAHGIEAHGAQAVSCWFNRAIDAGLGERYFPVISELIAAPARARVEQPEMS